MAEERTTTLPISTLLLVEELWNGDALVTPIADLSWTSYHHEVFEALLEQEI
ncbi:MAG: hypothetical protein RMJ98_19150 [Myxococcales bacterium]|nr:hypothetical protein [Polyangiaceae bacterium]MDW8251417.1 hypothetical protein [Myxococcales bacterium]